MQNREEIRNNQRVDQKHKVFKIAKEIMKTNLDVIGRHGIRNDDGVLDVNDECKKVVEKSFLKVWNKV